MFNEKEFISNGINKKIAKENICEQICIDFKLKENIFSDLKLKKNIILNQQKQEEDIILYQFADPENVKDIVMIDGENLPNIVENFDYNPNRQVFLYCSKHHHLCEKKLKPHIILKISPCTRPDGCDNFMVMDIIEMPKNYINVKKITIFTKDKFASCIVDNFYSFYPNIHVVHECRI